MHPSRRLALRDLCSMGLAPLQLLKPERFFHQQHGIG